MHSFCSVFTLMDHVCLPDFGLYNPEITHIHVLFVLVCASRIFLDILWGDTKPSYLWLIIAKFREFLPIFKQNPMLYLAAGLIVFLGIFICLYICNNLLIVCFGLTPCINNFFSYYIFTVARICLMNSLLSLIFFLLEIPD